MLPDQINSNQMCITIAEFAANYTTRSNHELTEDENTDALPLAEDDKVGRCESIKLQCGLTKERSICFSPIQRFRVATTPAENMAGITTITHKKLD